MAKELQIWTRDNEDNGIIVYESDIEKKYPLYNCYYIKFPSITENVSELIEKLNNALSSEEETIGIDEIEGFLSKNGIQTSFEHCNDVEDVATSPVLAFDNYEHSFFDLQDYKEQELYQYWDGHNWKTIWADDCSITHCTVSDERVCLDEWDGRNMVTGGIGSHEYIYKVYQEDGEKTEDKYLVVYSSQWEGVLDTAEIVTEEELREHLKEIDRDEDYIDLCRKVECRKIEK